MDRKWSFSNALMNFCALATCFYVETSISSGAQAQELASQSDTRLIEKPFAKDRAVNRATAKLPRRSQSALVAKGPFYVDFRARTAASYGHAFVWFGKSSERKVDVAGLHPAGDMLPYMLGHLMWVPSETGASYGDLDEQYLTANYRVYLNEPDAKKVFAYIRKLQANSPLWNAETSNCTAFIGSIASYMGLQTPFHLKLPEDYINSLRSMNGGRETVQLSAEQQASAE